MGGIIFEDFGYGRTAEQAYNRAVKQAQYDCGHAGYTGTIAEKGGYIVVECPIDDVSLFVEAVIEYGRSKTCELDAKHLEVVKTAHVIFNKKWDEALCIPLKERNEKKEKRFMFCGWASC